jgi:hypothetical protein
VGDLPSRVDARVHPAGPHDIDGLTERGREGSFEGGLYGGDARLHLPAVEVAAVVLDQKSVGWHGKM